jgi:hypothetical protein
MLCNQLQQLQHNFAALLIASERQDDLERQGMVPVEDTEAVKAFREELERRLLALGSQLAAHVREHGCAN